METPPDLWSPKELAVIDQAIGLDWQPSPIETAVALFEKIEAATHSSNFHELVDELEAGMEALEDIQLDLQPVHHFCDGIYIRELTIPKGTLLTGKIHKNEHLCIVSAGDILVWSEGTGVEFIKAPATFKSPKGVRRIGYAQETTVWSTVHPTKETNIDKLEADLYELRPRQLETLERRFK